jgi:hypothetical protein
MSVTIGGAAVGHGKPSDSSLEPGGEVCSCGHPTALHRWTSVVSGLMLPVSVSRCDAALCPCSWLASSRVVRLGRAVR